MTQLTHTLHCVFLHKCDRGGHDSTFIFCFYCLIWGVNECLNKRHFSAHLLFKPVRGENGVWPAPGTDTDCVFYCFLLIEAVRWRHSGARMLILTVAASLWLSGVASWSEPKIPFSVSQPLSQSLCGVNTCRLILPKVAPPLQPVVSPTWTLHQARAASDLGSAKLSSPLRAK